MFKAEIQTLRKCWTHVDLAVRCSSYPSYSIVRVLSSGRPASAARAGTRGPGPNLSGADRSRTDDIQLAKLALYQLSYSPIKPCRELVGLGGFEPPTSRLSGVRSRPTEL